MLIRRLKPQNCPFLAFSKRCVWLTRVIVLILVIPHHSRQLPPPLHGFLRNPRSDQKHAHRVPQREPSAVRNLPSHSLPVHPHGAMVLFRRLHHRLCGGSRHLRHRPRVQLPLLFDVLGQREDYTLPSHVAGDRVFEFHQEQEHGHVWGDHEEVEGK